LAAVIEEFAATALSSIVEEAVKVRLRVIEPV